MQLLQVDETKNVTGGVTMEVNGASYTIFIHNNEGAFFLMDCTQQNFPNFKLSADHSSITIYDLLKAVNSKDNYITFGGLVISRENVTDGVILNISRT